VRKEFDSTLGPLHFNFQLSTNNIKLGCKGNFKVLGPRHDPPGQLTHDLRRKLIPGSEISEEVFYCNFSNCNTKSFR